MSGASHPLRRALDALERLYGPPAPPPVTDPLGLILWESVAYLVDDERRGAAFRALASRVGISAEAILEASPAVLEEIAGLGGIMSELRAGKLREIAEIALDRFGGDVAAQLRRPGQPGQPGLPPAQARRELRRFPGIGEPGAEKILLFTGTEPVLALDSNGLRVLLRLGYGKEATSYASSYRSAQKAAAQDIEENCARRVRAYELLRRHGLELCRRSAPKCEICPLTASCAWYSTNRPLVSRRSPRARA